MNKMIISFLCSSIIFSNNHIQLNTPIPFDSIHSRDYGLYAGLTNEDFESYVVDVDEDVVEYVSAPAYDEDELELLAKLIYRETGGQGLECMIACGSVVINRINSDNYPDTLEEVIFQRGQYSVTFNRDRFWSTEPSEDAYYAAELVLTSGSQIPSNVMYQGKSDSIGSGVWKIIGGEVYCYD